MNVLFLTTLPTLALPFGFEDRSIKNIGEIHYHKENKTNWGKQIEFSAESNQFEKKSKVGINEKEIRPH